MVVGRAVLGTILFSKIILLASVVAGIPVNKIL